MNTYEELWQNVLLCCKHLTNDTAYSLWFEPIEMVDFTGGDVILRLNSEFKKKVVSEKYDNILKKAFYETLQAVDKLLFVDSLGTDINCPCFCIS